MASIIFDLDGTLIDSAPDIQTVANAVLAEFGAAPLSLKQTRGFIGNGAAVFVQRMFALRELPHADLAPALQQFLQRYEGAVSLTKPFPGVRQCLEDLLGQGHSLGICTNKPLKPTHAVLQHLNLAGYFQVIVGGDSLPMRKPDPAPLMAVATELKHAKVVFVGDSEVDAKTAQAAGVPFWLFANRYRKSPIALIPHDIVFAEFAELGGLAATVTP